MGCPAPEKLEIIRLVEQSHLRSVVRDRWRIDLRETGSSDLSLCGFLLVLQAALLNCVPFDPFHFQQDCLTAPEVEVGVG